MAWLPIRAGFATSAQRLQLGTTTSVQSAQLLRAAGCQGRAGVRTPLRTDAKLDRAARGWAMGTPLRSALEASGYREEASAALHAPGGGASLRFALERKLCGALTDARYRDIGIFERGRDSWLVLAAPFLPPPASSAPQTAAALVQQIDHARAAARRCGARMFPAAPPLRLDARLSAAAAAHANDMLTHDYFEHAGIDGSTPAARVAADGYRARIVGENIAFGPQTVAEAVQGWLHSPGHCENIMDPRFTDTGLAFAASHRGEARIYWVEDFAAPR